MVTQREAIDVIEHTLRSSDKITDEMSFLTHEADPDGQDSAVTIPLIEIDELSSSRDDPSNSNFVEYLTNDSGEQVGTVYETKWELSIRLDAWTADGSVHDPDEIGKQMHEILYQYDSRGPDATFHDADGTPVTSIYDFSLQGGERNDSLIETPSVRRWRQYARVRGVQTMVQTATEPPIRGYDETINL